MTPRAKFPDPHLFRALFAIAWIIAGEISSTSVMAQTASSMWEHNGSAVSLESNGHSRKFYYDTPRSTLLEFGVRPGTLLFEGRRDGFQYSGTAYVFSKHCGPLAYEVAGPVAPDQRSVVLTGRAPSPSDDSCKHFTYQDDILVFNYAPQLARNGPSGSLVQDDKQVCSQRKEAEAAIRACTKLLTAAYSDEQIAEILDLRGLAYQKRQDLTHAMADWTEAIRRNTKYWYAYWDRAWGYADHAQFEKAIDDLERARALVAAAAVAKPSEALTKDASDIGKDMKTIKLSGEMEKLWVDYLKTIQAEDDYRNWPKKPFELYMENHRSL